MPSETSTEDHFEALGAPRRFGQDRPRLEKRFYELSRALHPDRFSALGGEAHRLSLARMSALNRAWATLKSADATRDHLLSLEGAKPDADKKGQLPLELAEGWFEIQDLLAEDPTRAGPRLAAFELELRELQSREQARLARLEAEWDEATGASSGRTAILGRISEAIRALSYLKSMQRDVDRIKVRVAG
jgi:molecular chaperone HscB